MNGYYVSEFRRMLLEESMNKKRKGKNKNPHKNNYNTHYQIYKHQILYKLD